MTLIDPNEPWLVEVVPGLWISTTTDTVMEAAQDLIAAGQETPETAEQKLEWLLRQGVIRRNPGCGGTA